MLHIPALWYFDTSVTCSQWFRSQICCNTATFCMQGWGQFNSGIGIAAQFQFQFQNRNWNWNWWNWKWNWNWKPWNWNWNWNPKLNFFATDTAAFTSWPRVVDQPFPNFSFNRGGNNLSCDWLFMQQMFLGHCPTAVWSQNTHGQGTLFPLCGQRPEGLKIVTINISSPPTNKTLSMLNKLMISGLGVKLSQHTSFSLILLIGIFRSFMIIHWDKCHGTLLINLMISPHCFR